MIMITRTRTRSNPALNIHDAIAHIEREIARGSTSMRLSDGRQQMRRSVGDLCSDLCRTDAVGHISRRDRDTVLAAIARLQSSGILHGELNGYPLIAP